MIIHVRRKHIKAGLSREGASCPIALALSDCGLISIFVAGTEVFYGDTVRYAKKLPVKAQKFIKNFDNNKSVKPFSFGLNVGKDGGR